MKLTFIDNLMIFGTLILLIGMPIKALLVYIRRTPPEAVNGVTTMRVTRGWIWLAAWLALMGWMHAIMRARAERGDPDIFWVPFEPQWAFVTAGVMTAIAAAMVIWASRQTVRYDAEGITRHGKRSLWSELAEAGVETKTVKFLEGSGHVSNLPATSAFAKFNDRRIIKVRDAMNGRDEFDKFLKAEAKRQGVKFRRINRDKKK